MTSVASYPAKPVPVTLQNVWESVPEQSLKVLDSACVHYFILPNGAREVIGQCKKCNGERWFQNYYEAPIFNHPTTAEQMKAYADAEKSNGEPIPDILPEGMIA